MRHGLRLGWVMAGWLLVVNPGVAAAQTSSAVTSFWESVARGAGSGAASTVVGYALSALGLSSSSGIEADLTDIEDLLTEIDSELEELVQEIAALECLTAQDQTTLTDSIKDIQGLYDTYQDWVAAAPTIPCWEESDDSSNVCFGQTGVKTWLDEVTDPEDGVQASLDAIADVMIQAGNTGVIYVCVVDITSQYTSGSGPTENPFDDRPYYDEVEELTDYYYGVQAQGAALLSEAYHVQACLSLGSSDCSFLGESTEAYPDVPGGTYGATPDDPDELCANAPPDSEAAADCLDATTAIEQTYSSLSAQLTQAGAPYSTDDLGLLWGTAYIFPRSLLDFTNHATYSGKSSSTCSSLSSSSPCGWTVGENSLTFPTDVSYGGYPADGESNLWVRADITSLTHLLATYNSQTTGSTSGTLGQWMDSIGFTSVGSLIVYSGNTAKNSAIDTDVVCFMDTSVARSHSGQPWCDGTSGASGTDNLMHSEGSSCGGACYGTEYTTASYLSTSSYGGFYNVNVDVKNDYGFSYDYKTKAGWFNDEQGSSYHQFHWGMFEVTSLSCTVRTAGNKNPGGQYTLCGSDLTSWLSSVLTPPTTS